MNNDEKDQESHAVDLIEQLQKDNSEVIRKRAINWLSSNPKNSKSDLLFTALVRTNQSEDLIEWSFSFFEKYPLKARALLHILITNLQTENRKEVLTSVVSWISRAELPEEVSTLISVDLVERYGVVALIQSLEQKLKSEIDSKIEPTVLVALLKTAPSETICVRAQNWIMDNFNNWYSIIVLAKLLEVKQTDELVQLSMNRLSCISPDETESFLLIAPLLRSGLTGKQFLSKWILEHLNDSLIEEAIFEAFRIDPDFFSIHMNDWIHENPGKLNSSLRAEIDAWVRKNPENPIAEELKCMLQ